MLAYLLDTDTISFILRGQGPAASRLTAHQPSEVCISSLTLGELRFGAERRHSRKLHGIIDTFVRTVQVMPFDEACAAAYGRIQAGLESKGTPIGTLDTLIAAHAFALNVTLVTNNQKHFSKVRGLKIANWSEDAG
jgi:tRNA(fMet)-specific endonuclease VapC